MFVSANQIYIFIASVAIGCCFGIVLTLFKGFEFIINNKIFTIFNDILLFIFCGFVFVIVSYLLDFTNIRIYMIAGVFVGIILYFKSFHFILAKCMKKVYNRFNKIIAKKREKRYERNKSKKINRRINRRGGVASCSSAFSDDLSVSIHKCNEKKVGLP